MQKFPLDPHRDPHGETCGWKQWNKQAATSSFLDKKLPKNLVQQGMEGSTAVGKDEVGSSNLPSSSKKTLKPQGFMFIGTQCDLWGRPDGTGHEKISRGKFPRLIFSLIPSLFERHISIGCADLIWDITLDEISALCLFIGRGPFFA